MFTIKVEDHFSAAHRIEGHPKCGRLHGHNYVIEVCFVGEIHGMGYVADFADLKEILKKHIERLDHRYIISNTNIEANDPYFEAAIDRGEGVAIEVDVTSAEQLAEWFFHEVEVDLNIDSGVRIEYVRVYETVNTWAQYDGRESFPN